ncbi:TetR family transcriptional regulator [Streptacidiphilus jiangxiensis]|uniref:DNA-binding transcriptional regulator, AcrR family n=1 Tax=Streptacidiphilus jiangxiensis TaxID=235985 RepID=A0A1H7HKK0_STRJI|nr:TetR family transcriptional regulator [Streptacidiphilus jiangxiensis]SEK50824.1 DNA-binding transcriptional regulator, AcrR family [Streptacidiphilus jiangxiensis]
MGRWEPNARGRLEQAALELYVERGFERTTVAEIAERAGLTERTFFRHFADKREVLFGGSFLLQQHMVDGAAAAPQGATPLEAVGAALDAVGEVFRGRHAHARRRQAVIAANPELRERELIKMTTLSAALAETLRGRGLAEPAASLAAEAGIAVFHVAFGQWVAGDEEQDMRPLLRDALEQLRAVTGTG